MIRKEPYRRDSINRAIKTLLALSRRNGATVRELTAILGFSGNRTSSYESAKAWLDAAACQLPVIEIGRRHSANATQGPEATAYRIDDALPAWIIDAA